MQLRKWMVYGLALLTVSAGTLSFSQDRRTEERRVRTTQVKTVRQVAGRHRTWHRRTRRNTGLPPGLAKGDQMTPGHENRLRKQGALPPGIAKKIRD